MARSPGHQIPLNSAVAFPVAALLAVAACTPTVRVVAPEEPITINLNVKIEQEVRVKLEKDVEQLLKTNDELF